MFRKGWPIMNSELTDQEERWAADHLWFPFSRPGEVAGESSVTILSQGDGAWMTTTDGRRLLDGVGGMEAMAVGHGQQRLVAAATRQLEELSFVDTFRYTTRPAIELGRKLAMLAPKTLNRIHYTPGGSEAVEVAIKLAIQYHYLRGEKERRRVVTRSGAFHGVTFGAMNCDGGYYATRNDIYLGGDRFGVVAEPATEESGWGLGARHASGAAELRAAVERVGPATVAAVIVDAAASASGVATPPASDLQAIRAMCDEFGILLIVDEVITGFCRTGAWFMSELYGVEPDLMPISKAMSSGYMPIGGTLISDRVVDVFNSGDPKDTVFAHGQTFAAHPVACAVSLENIAMMEEWSYAARAANLGATLREKLRALEFHPSFVDIRGVGMVNGLEVQLPYPTSRFRSPREAAQWLRIRLRELGLILIAVHPGTVFLVTPPIAATEDDFDKMVEILDRGLAEFERELLA
jgi:adenosylmethionine-8-amino-7-oxononanoate aminotransferase